MSTMNVMVDEVGLDLVFGKLARGNRQERYATLSKRLIFPKASFQHTFGDFIDFVDIQFLISFGLNEFTEES